MADGVMAEKWGNLQPVEMEEWAEQEVPNGLGGILKAHKKPDQTYIAGSKKEGFELYRHGSRTYIRTPIGCLYLRELMPDEHGWIHGDDWQEENVAVEV